jgi:hypothetical protein
MCSVLQDDKHDPAQAIRSMIKVTRVMANYLNTDDRYRIAETMRDAADAWSIGSARL